MTALLEAKDLAVGYAGKAVLHPITASLPSGQLVCLVGANGSGKSTLLRTLAGLQAAVAGEVRLARRPLKHLPARERARLLGLVLTDRVAVPALRGAELVALGRHPFTGWTGRLSPSDHDAVDRALDDTGCTPLAHRLVAELSDGERQRLLVARALAQEPKVLVLDEATAFLDLPRRVGLMHLLRRVARVRDIAVLLSTHDLELALRYADDIWLIDPGGKLEAGAPEDLVLSGHFEAAFQRHGLVFDVDRGTLLVAERARGAVAVGTTGKVGRWLAHAARRAGFEVAEDAPTRIEATLQGYRITCEGGAAVHVDSVRALVTALREDLAR